MYDCLSCRKCFATPARNTRSSFEIVKLFRSIFTFAKFHPFFEVLGLKIASGALQSPSCLFATLTFVRKSNLPKGTC